MRRQIAATVLLCVAILTSTVTIHAQPPREHTLRPWLVLRVGKGGERKVSEAWVSNNAYWVTLVWFSGIPAGKWEAELCVECRGPEGKLPLRVEARPMDMAWGFITDYNSIIRDDRLAHVLWSDGYEFYFEGRGWQCIPLNAEVDYWQQVHNWGLILRSARSELHPTAGRTYWLNREMLLHLRRR